jgi:uridylate kinase
MAEEIRSIRSTGVQVAIVIGGGNIFRGSSGSARGFSRVQGDTIGMLATVINSFALSSVLEEIDVPSKLLTSVSMVQVADPYREGN